MKRQPQTFIDHIHELRSRLAISAGFFALGSVIAYIFRKPLLIALNRPSHQTL